MNKLYNFLIATALIFSIQVVKAQADSLDIYPNPFQDSCTIVMRNLSDDTVSLEIYNRWGEVVKNFHTNDVLSGDYTYQFHADTLPKGNYVVAYIVNGDRQLYRISKLNATGIGELQNETPDLLIYPNPASNFIYISLPTQNSTPSYSYQIVSSNGRIVKRGELSEPNINVQDLPAGRYTLSILFNKKNKHISRFIVQ